MLGRAKVIVIVIMAFILLGLLSFLLLTKYYTPLNRSLFGGDIPISFTDIQFWVKEVPGKNYYRVDARYLKSSIGDSGGICFDDKMGRGGVAYHI